MHVIPDKTQFLQEPSFPYVFPRGDDAVIVNETCDDGKEERDAESMPSPEDPDRHDDEDDIGDGKGRE
ncbi:hypothetical protein NDQ57_16565 [Rossellomorea marisflavi]|uniref:hypothetical protein n=1 Tax=Rossellomorea marisflavi TaxID=189381 RepID=UPI00203EAB12|nr:hypothetical protein [Rossellomorea marisflavi]MCM2606284.1 hypothetical protein [Rossellomorea marisflavi]